MGRPERPIDPEAGPLQRFVFELRELRTAAGRPSYRELARRSHYSVTALAQAAGGDSLPTLPVTLAYVQACGGDRMVWESRWREVEAALADPPVDPPAAPYPGLASFEAADADRFCGRQPLVDQLCGRLAESSLLAVFGASGSGKSSLLRAGLIPALGDDTDAVLLTPGPAPIAELAVALASVRGISAGSVHTDLASSPGNVRLAVRQCLTGSAAQRLVIVVDQFEEVFTLCQDVAGRKAFLDALLAASNEPGCRVVLGVRADFYARCAEHAALVAALQDQQVLIGPMNADELRAAITGPAALHGLRVEPALVQAIVTDIEGEPGALPLMSHALLETWKRRKGTVLSLAAYQTAGGVRTAIARTAEEVFEELDEAGQRLARDVFLRLTALGDGTEDTRRRARRDELPSGCAAVLDRLVAARLITVDQDWVSVAHEALIRNWPRLCGWLAEDRESLLLHRRLTEAASEWEQLNRDDDYLYRGSRLTAWRDRAADDLNDVERRFLAASFDDEAREHAARRRRLRRSVTALCVGMVVVLVLAVIAFVQADRAADERDVAFSRQLAASARDQLQREPELALLLARRAFDVEPTAQADAVLRQAVTDVHVRAVLQTGHGPTYGVGFGPNGKLATSGDDGTVRVWDGAAPDANPTVLEGHRGQVWSPVFSPDGTRLAAAGVDGAISVWDLSSGQRRVLTGHTKAVWNVAFSADGTRLASTSDDHTTRTWDLVGSAEAGVLVHPDRVLGVAFAPDGRIATGAADGVVRVWNPADDGEPLQLRGHEGTVEAVAFSPDGTRLVSAGTEGTARVWPSTGGDGVVLRAPAGTVETVAFSPDNRHVASAGDDGTVWVWSAASDSNPLVLRGHSGPVWSLVFDAEGKRLASASSDGTVRLWDPSGPGEPMTVPDRDGPLWTIAISRDGRVAACGADGVVRVREPGRAPVEFRGHEGPVFDVEFSPDGKRVASAGADGTVRVWQEGAPPVVLRGHTGMVWSVAFSSDGSRLVSASPDGTVRLWPVTGGESTAVPTNQGGSRQAVFSPDGRKVVSAGADGTIRLIDSSDTSNVVVLRGHSGPAQPLAYHPDGTRLVSGGIDGTIRVWDVRTGEEASVLRGHQGSVSSVAFNADGRLLVSSGADGTARVWPVAGGEPTVARGFAASVGGATFAPDGQNIFTAHDDGTVRRWRCDACAPAQRVLELARQRSTRELTDDERRLFSP